MVYQKEKFITLSVLMACKSTQNAKRNLLKGTALPLTTADTVRQLQEMLQKETSKN